MGKSRVILETYQSERSVIFIVSSYYFISAIISCNRNVTVTWLTKCTLHNVLHKMVNSHNSKET